MDEKLIEQNMKLLDISREEAIQMLEDDKAIDKGKRMDFDLDEKTEKEMLKQAHKGKKKKQTVYNFNKRQRKENPTKQSVISALKTFLEESESLNCENVDITNKERQIAFSIGDDKFELTLVQKRKPKEG